MNLVLGRPALLPAMMKANRTRQLNNTSHLNNSLIDGATGIHSCCEIDQVVRVIYTVL